MVIGASLTAAMVIVTVEVLLSPVPSLALKVKVSVPLKLVSGVYVTVESVKLVVPLDTSDTILKVTSSPSASLAVILISTAVSSSVDAVSSSVVGASLTALTVTVTTDTAPKNWPS